MTQGISFLHAADLHLDSPFTGLAQVPDLLFNDIRKSTFVALDNLIQAAIDKNVDFVLITGDLFDNEKQSLKAQIRLRDAFLKLEEYCIDVYISYGNHDYVKGNIHPLTYPDNVFEFTDETISHFTYEKNGQTLAAIYGFSYVNRVVDTNKAKEYEVVDKHIPYHIAMLHGSVSSNTEHDHYAPFHLTDLTHNEFDYWALGHIHKRQVLHTDPYIVYPGNIQGRNRKETGEKGCFHVSLSQEGTSVSFVSLEAIQYQAMTLDVSNCTEIHQLEQHLQHAIKTSFHESTPYLIDLHLTGETPKLMAWETEKYVAEIIELMNESMAQRSHWRFIFRYSIAHQGYATEKDLKHGEHFMGELIRHFDEVSIQPFLTDLYQHRDFRKYITTLSEREEELIMDDAKQLLINELLKTGGK